jgi:hypothetical protein
MPVPGTFRVLLRSHAEHGDIANLLPDFASVLAS